MFRFYTYLFIILFSIVAFPIISSGQDIRHLEVNNERLDSNKNLLVGVISNSPPFQYMANNMYTGFNIEVMNFVAEEQGMKIKYTSMSHEQGITAIQDGTIDILIGVPFTEESSHELEFTDSFITSSIGVLVPVANEIENLSDLREKTVALQSKTVEYEFIQNIRDVHLHVTNNQPNAVQLMIDDRADALIGNQLTIEHILEQNHLQHEFKFIENHLLPLDYSFAVKQGNYSLLHQLNIGIRHFKLSNDYPKIYRHWFGELETPLYKRIKIVRDTLIILVTIAAVVIWISLRWNRSLQRQVQEKTYDLRNINNSLKNEKRKAEESDQLKEQILESSLRGVITLNNQGIILTINTVACQLFHVNKNIVGTHVKSVLFNWEKFKKAIEDVTTRKRVYKNEQINVSDYYETIEFINYDIQPLYNAQQTVVGTLLSFEDVTDEQRIKEQLAIQEQSRALIQLVAGVAHEIRNPLTSIKTFVEMMPMKMHSKKFRDEITYHVPTEIDRLNELVEALINYAKPKSDNKQLINLSSIMHFVALLFKSKVEHHGYKLVTEIKEDQYIIGDENQIKQVLINIILNAIESTNEKALHYDGLLAIYIRLYKEGESIFIEIEDEGIGMSEEMTERIFEPFFTSKTEGTGLGLALSRQFIIENNGDIYVDSKLDEYSKFTLQFLSKEDNNATRINHR